VYAPIVGGGVLVAALYWLWVSILQAWRTSRPLRREPWMWVGFGLGLIPPAVELLLYLRDWKP
jgi:hypothetical protein